MVGPIPPTRPRRKKGRREGGLIGIVGTFLSPRKRGSKLHQHCVTRTVKHPQLRPVRDYPTETDLWRRFKVEARDCGHQLMHWQGGLPKCVIHTVIVSLLKAAPRGPGKRQLSPPPSDAKITTPRASLLVRAVGGSLVTDRRRAWQL